MKSMRVWMCVLAAVVAVSAWQVSAQETPAKSAVKKDPRGPLPAQFGKLGLSDEVKDELYKVHEEYNSQIQTLAAQIKKLQAEKLVQMEVKLTPAQKTRLKELRDEAAAKKALAEKQKADAEKTAPPAPKKLE